jgi:hypothetical protein
MVLHYYADLPVVDVIPPPPLQSHCDSGEVEGGQIPSLSINASVRFVVTANTDTSWQVVIFDPAPE